MSIQTQVSGFARFQVEQVARVYGVDAKASWCGREISDKLIVTLREKADALGKVSMHGSKDVLIVVDASKLFVWKAKLAKDGQTYERNSDTKETTRGTLDALRATYGKANVHITDENGARKLCASKKADKGTLNFYSLAHLAKAEKAEKAEKAKGSKDGKTVVVASKTAAAVTKAAKENKRLIVKKMAKKS